VEAVKRATAAEAALAPNAATAAEAEQQLQELLLYVYRGFAAMLSEELLASAGAAGSDDAAEGAARGGGVEQAAWVLEALALVRTFGRMYQAEVGAVATELEVEMLPTAPPLLKAAISQSLYLTA
jgi:hypothetical protein